MPASAYKNSQFRRFIMVGLCAIAVLLIFRVYDSIHAIPIEPNRLIKGIDRICTFKEDNMQGSVLSLIRSSLRYPRYHLRIEGSCSDNRFEVVILQDLGLANDPEGANPDRILDVKKSEYPIRLSTDSLSKNLEANTYRWYTPDHHARWLRTWVAVDGQGFSTWREKITAEFFSAVKFKKKRSILFLIIVEQPTVASDDQLVDRITHRIWQNYLNSYRV